MKKNNKHNRDWTKYISQNKVGQDCQLVTAVNAYYFLTGKTITEKKYEKFIDLCKCRNGSVINIEKVHRRLKIKPMRYFGSIYDLKYSRLPLPIEINIWHKWFGYHSALIVGYEKKYNIVRVTNLKRVTSREGWIFMEDLNHYCIRSLGGEEPQWKLRLFERI